MDRVGTDAAGAAMLTAATGSAKDFGAAVATDVPEPPQPVVMVHGTDGQCAQASAAAVRAAPDAGASCP